jgi:hypothetical protein
MPGPAGAGAAGSHVPGQHSQPVTPSGPLPWNGREHVSQAGHGHGPAATGRLLDNCRPAAARRRSAAQPGKRPAAPRKPSSRGPGTGRPAPHSPPAHGPQSPQHTVRGRRGAERANRPGRPRCSITGLVTVLLHRFGDFFPSTRWGPGRCPDRRPQLCCARVVLPAHGPVDSWTNTVHRLWTKDRSTDRAARCPPVTHRLWAVVPSDRRLLHTPVHCSARHRPRSLRRVKGVTRGCRTGVWETGANLGTQLGRTGLGLWVGCAELSVLHRAPELSTPDAHRVRGQNQGVDLRKRGYPRYPQGLLLRPTSRERGIRFEVGPVHNRPSRARLPRATS